jgi:hypothetical protein
MVGMCLVKSIYALPTWSRTCRLAAEHPTIRSLLGCAPSQWACYRFAKMLRTRDAWTLSRTLDDVIGSLREQPPNFGRDIAIDGSDLPAYANGNRVGPKAVGIPRRPSDPDAAWGHRSAVSNRGKGQFYGYKIHAAVDVATDLPLAWNVESGNEQDQHFAVGLIDQVRQRGLPVETAAMDTGYDNNLIYVRCEHRDVVPIIALRNTAGVKKAAPDRRIAYTANGRSPGPTTSAKQRSGAARPASVSPPRSGSVRTGSTRSSRASPSGSDSSTRSGPQPSVLSAGSSTNGHSFRSGFGESSGFGCTPI